MADAVSVQTLADDGNHVVLLLQSTSDGTGESAVVKADVSALVGAPAAVAIRRITGVCYGMVAKLLWDATTPVIAFTCPQDQPFDVTFEPPLRNPVASGATGDVKLTTIGHTAADTYSIQLDLIKAPLS